MTQAGIVYCDNGAIEAGIWSCEDGYVILTSMSGDMIAKIPDNQFKDVLTDFCQSEPK